MILVCRKQCQNDLSGWGSLGSPDWCDAKTWMVAVGSCTNWRLVTGIRVVVKSILLWYIDTMFQNPAIRMYNMLVHINIFKKKKHLQFTSQLWYCTHYHPFLCHVSWDPVLMCTSRPWRAHDIRVHVVFQVSAVSAVISSNRPMVSQITGKPKPHMTKQ